MYSFIRFIMDKFNNTLTKYLANMLKILLISIYGFERNIVIGIPI